MSVGLLLAVPFGIMADRMGRRFVILLCCFGALFAEAYTITVLWFWRIFPTYAIAVFPLFLCIGGGGVVFAAVILTVVADVCPSHLRYDLLQFSKFYRGLTAAIVPASSSPWASCSS
jgi:MFS family permease